LSKFNCHNPLLLQLFFPVLFCSILFVLFLCFYSCPCCFLLNTLFFICKRLFVYSHLFICIYLHICLFTFVCVGLIFTFICTFVLFCFVRGLIQATITIVFYWFTNQITWKILRTLQINKWERRKVIIIKKNPEAKNTACYQLKRLTEIWASWLSFSVGRQFFNNNIYSFCPGSYPK